MLPCTSSPATSARMPPVVHSHFPSTCPSPVFQRMFPGFALGPASPPGDNRTPHLPSDSPHTATRIVVPPGTARCCEPAEYSALECAPPATLPLPPLPLPEPASPRVVPAAFPVVHSPEFSDAADCSGTSPRRSARPSSASGVPALLPASFSRVGLQPPPHRIRAAQAPR